MDRFEAMRTLVAAVDGGSLSAASRTLNLPLPTVSRRVSDLETMLGSQLVVRTSRKLLLTEAGSAYVASARRVLEELAEAERAASGEYRAPRGELLVTAPIMFGKMHVAPIIHDFLSAYPEVTVRLALTDGVVDLIESHVDVAVRLGNLPDSTLVAKRVGEVRWITCASPDYIARCGAPSSPEELSTHACIAYEGLKLWRDWTFAGPRGEQTTIIRPRYSVNTADAIIAGAAAGIGIAYIISYQAADSVRDGVLVPILSEWAPPPFPVQIVYAPRPHQPLKLKAFLDFVAPRLQQRLRTVGQVFEAEQAPVEVPV
ncbi:DNA-binding transcriptional LysR family regulator [Nitrospirillum amazonense]|uniref:DNA-binding transcriptional LysR family regulator n=1 Tax=Nitrospirillum amazonense TaxID=28077 RepID=A0A560KII8_9PROT|nr:LysR family transcriptional regulator [Nitrospirillum amazonense]TWB83081.1 DNA-binding transcriptional LysR family regulator [Nitrospirillum amazonense]